jgi:hypothetical protein
LKCPTECNIFEGRRKIEEGRLKIEEGRLKKED